MAIKYGYEIDINSDSTAAKVIRLVGTNKRVLEVGCSYGYMSKVLVEQFGCTVIGVELDREAAEQAEKVCERVIVGNAEQVDWKTQLKGESFDVIIFADVLEHLVNPWSLLVTMYDYLKDDGCIITSIPNVGYIGVITDLMHGQFRYRKLGILDDTHLRFFTLESIHEMFEKTGYYINLVDRTRVPYDRSEFNNGLIKLSDELLACIKALNADCDTYQYVTKALKSNSSNRLVELVDENQKLKDKLNQYEIVMAENKELKEYAAKVEKDISEVNAYARNLEKQTKGNLKSSASGLFKKDK